MKKIFSLLVMMLLGMTAAWATDVTFTAGVDTGDTSVSKGGVTVTTSTMSRTDNYRVYKSADLTITSTVGNITNVEITGVSGNPASNMTLKEGSAGTWSTDGNNGTWTGSASTLTLTASTAQARITEIVVTIDDGGTPATFYDVHINEMSNGSVTASPTSAAQGETVTLTVSADSGYMLETLTVEDDDDNAVNVTDNQFVMPASDVYVSATFVERPAASGDVINYAFTGISGTGYADWTATGASGTVYAGQSGGQYSSVQLRSNNNNSGIVNTSSVGNARKVTVTWNTNTISGRTLNVYGSNSAYTAATDLYGDNAGTLIGTIVCGTSTELVIEDDYAYIGLRSAGSAMYLDEIVIEWEAGEAPAVATPTISGTTPFENQTEVTITCTTTGVDIYYTLDGSDPDDESTPYGGPFTITEGCTVKAIAYDGDNNASQIASKEFEKIQALQSIAEFNALADEAEANFGFSVVAIYQHGTTLYVQETDGSKGMLVYGNVGQTYSLGNVIPAGFSGTKATYNGAPELKNPANFAAATSTVEVTPMEATVNDCTLDNFGRYVVFNNVEVANGAVTGVTTYTTTFGVAIPADEGTYNMYGVIGWHNSDYQILPILFEPVDVPQPETYTVTIDDTIEHGNVSADKAEAAEGETVTLTVTPDNGYVLDEIIAIADVEGIDVVIAADNTFVMPASNVTIMATFVEGEQPAVTSVVFEYGTGKEFAQSNGEVMEANTKGGVTISWEKGTSNNDPKWYSASNGNARAYSGNNIVIDAGSATIKTVTFTYDGNYALSSPTVSPGTFDNDVWTVNASSGTLTPGGTTRISTITVELGSGETPVDQPLQSIPEFIGSEGEQEFGFPVIALGHKKADDSGSGTGTGTGTGGSMFSQSDALYVIDQTNEHGLLIYGNISQDYGFGDVIPAGIKGTYKNFQEMPEMENPVDESFAEATDYLEPTPFEATIADINKDNFGRYAVLRGATIAKKEEESSSSTSFSIPGITGDDASYTITLGGETIDAHDTFKAEWPADEELADKYYDIYGICLWYKGIMDSDAKAYFIPLTFEEGTAPAETEWVKTDASALKTGDIVVFAEVDAKMSALPNDGGASAPVFTAITLNETGDKLAAEPAANLQWTVTVNNGSYQFQNADGDYLYCIANNNGVRVGANFDENTENFSITDGYLYNAVRGRYIGVYNTQDWRSYTSINNNIKDQTFAFFKKTVDEPVEGITLAEALAGGEGVISDELVVVRVFDGKAYVTDGEDNWVRLEGGNADELTPGAVIDGYQVSGIANPATSPAITLTDDVTFTANDNIPELDILDLVGGIEVMPKAGKLFAITGYYLIENDSPVFSAYSGKNGSKGNTLALADAGNMSVDARYTIEAAVELAEAWDAEAPAGAPRRVSPTSDDALKNVTVSLVSEPNAVTGVNDITIDADVVSVKYVNVAGQVSDKPFDGMNIVVTTYDNGNTKAVKVVK